ncbi:MAG: hypothetical protein L6R35_004874, partial [Caloplaca aegaea]
MSPIISTAVSPMVSIVPYPTPTPVEFGPLGYSSPTAIIIAWVLTAFLPIPLMLLVAIFRFSPRYIPDLLSRYPLLPRQLRTNGSSGGTPTANPSTPSSRTLTVSNRSSDTLPVVVPGQCPWTPSRDDGHGHEDPFNPRTPIHSLEMNRKSSETPSKSITSPPMSVGSPSNNSKSNNTAASPLASCFESPKRTDFLEPPSILSKKPYTRLSDGSSPRQPSVVQPPAATPHTIHRRRLQHRLLISTILFGLVLAMYVLDGFAIAAAHRFAHVRVLSRPNGNGGLGAGKEDERWLAPWTIYIFLQGSMVAGCAWMVWAMRRELRHCDEKWTREKGKGVVVDNDNNKPDDDGIVVRGSVSPPRSKSADEEEGERFLPPPPPPPPEGEGEPVIRDAAKADQNGREEVEEEEPDWLRLGFHPTFASEQLALSSPSTPSRPAPASTVSSKSKFRRGVNRRTANLHYSVGESSSSSRGAAAASPSSPGSGSLNPFSAFTLPAAERSSGAWWKHHRSNRGYKKPREEDEEEDPWRQILPSPLTTMGNDERGGGNSWAQEVQREADLRMSRSRSRSKGKGKEEEETIPEPEQEQKLRDEEEEEEQEEGGFELKPVVPRELLTGIDLSKPYQFTDGLAYPLFPLKAKRPEVRASNSNGGGDHHYHHHQQQQQQQQP